MKRLAQFLLLLCAFLPLRLNAQSPANTIDLPNSSFENWSNGNGYSVSIYGFPLQVYGDYTYPSSWDFPSYPVNETLTFSGMNINVNTNIPLMKVADESNAAHGAHALKMQSFMLSDIVNSTVYSLAQSSLDSALTTTVFPTILSTGVVDIEEFLPMMYTITSSLGSLFQLMMAFNDVDMNSIIAGGIALNGATPDKLTGYYKYASAVSGDNGGVMILGTKYNTTTHKREVVGGGYTTGLTDTSAYAPFEVTYSPLSEIHPSTPYIAADSIVVFLFSSANSAPQQGSTLYLDSLHLWAQGEVAPEDTCSAVFNLHVIELDSTHATIGWGFEGDPDHFEAEYGLQGFSQGNGTSVSASESFLHLSDLQPDTDYDIYVRCACDSSLYGEWSMISFHTDTLVPPVIHDSTGVQTFVSGNLKIYPNPAPGHCVAHFDQEIPQIVRLYNMEGALLKVIIPESDMIELTLPASGVYILSCEMKSGVINRKIVSQ